MFPGPSPYPTHLSVSPWPSPSHSLKESKFNKRKKERQNNAHRNVAVEWMTLQQTPAGQLYSRQSLLFIFFLIYFEAERLACGLGHFSCVRLLAILWTTAHGVPLSTGCSRQEHWSGLPFPPPGDPPNPGMEPVSPASPALQADPLPLSHWEAILTIHTCTNFSTLKIHKLTPHPQNVPPVPFQLILPHSWSSSPRQPLTCFWPLQINFACSRAS